MTIKKMNLQTVKKILDYLTHYPYATANEIAKVIKATPITVIKYLEELYKLGIVTFRKVGRVRKWKIDTEFIVTGGYDNFNKFFRSLKVRRR